MTLMPDVMAKTRICYGLEHVFNAASDASLLKWLDDLQNTSGFKAAELIDALPLDKWEPSDRDHIRQHVFGLPPAADRWWEKEALDVATEGFARAIWMMFYNLQEQKLPTRRPIDVWWSCPATHVFRVMLLESPGFVDNYPTPVGVGRVTAILLTPPKKDHTKHYLQYLARRNHPDLKPQPQDSPVPDPANYTQPEPMLLVSSTENAVLEGVDTSGNPVPVAKAWKALTATKVTNITTAQPLCENFVP